jgi:AraC-like DNA-binding protein
VHFVGGLLRWEGATGIWDGEVSGALPLPNVVALPEQVALERAFRQLFRVWEEKAVGYEWYARVELMNILVQFTELLCMSCRDAQASAQVVHKSIAYIRNHLSADLDRTLLARNACVSPGYLSTLFKKHTGYSPIQYITKMRMDRAKQLLRASTLPIHTVARSVGFTDPFYFSRVFAKEVGISPRDYRRA